MIIFQLKLDIEAHLTLKLLYLKNSQKKICLNKAEFLLSKSNSYDLYDLYMKFIILNVKNRILLLS